MSKCLPSRRVTLLGGIIFCSFLPIAARADEIVVLVDANGRKIFVNTCETRSRVDWMTRSFGSDASGATPATAADIDQMVRETAARYQVDPDLVRAIVRVESDYDPRAVSNKGAMGLMQLVPATAQRFGVTDPFDPKQNIEGGVTYLKYLMDMFDGDVSLSLAAYNSGEHTVQRSGGVPAIPQTQNYVRKVRSIYQTGDAPGATQPAAAKATSKEPPKAQLLRYVDQYGVVHYTNVE